MSTKGQGTGKLPKPAVINILLYMDWLGRQGIYAIDSNLMGIGYATDGDNTKIITASKGYISIKTKDIPQICEELMGIYEDDKDRKRMGVK
jgi:hypothetical protein